MPEPLGYSLTGMDKDEKEIFTLAGSVAQALIKGCRNTCRSLGIKGSTKCSTRKLAGHMLEVPEFIKDKQPSSARGSARTALALILGWNPDIDLELYTAGVPPDCDRFKR